MALDPKLVSPKEQPLFTIGVVLASLIWLALVVGTLGIGLIYLIPISIFLLMAQALFLAHVKGNGVRVSERQLPELHARVKAAAQRLGLAEAPEVYVMQAGGILNAFATKLFSRRFVIVFSELVDACSDPRQLDFVIGHELGHHAAGHLKWNFFLAPYHLVPWAGPAYSRAREYTCDRCGYAVAQDAEQAMRGLAVLAAGGKNAQRVDLQAFMEQQKETGGFWMGVYELVASHPYLCKRVAAIQELVAPGTAPAPGRNALAYVFGPFFGAAAAGTGGAAGAMLGVVMVMGILAAIAIPSFMKYEQRSRMAGLDAMVRAQQAQAESDAANGGAPPATGDDGLTAEQRQAVEALKRQLDEQAAAAQQAEPAAPPAPTPVKYTPKAKKKRHPRW